MAEFKNNENSGVLFRNNKKGNDKAPAWKGTINVDGKEWQMAAWERVGAKGDFYSLKVEPPFVKTEKKEPENLNTPGSDLPF